MRQRILGESLALLREGQGDRPIELEVDGGVNAETAPAVIAAGANVLVAGSAVFQGDDYVETINARRP